MARSFSKAATLTCVVLLSACGGGGLFDDSTSPAPEPWNGPGQYFVYKPETESNATPVTVKSANGEIYLDGQKRYFQSKQGSLGFIFTAGRPWNLDGENFTGGSEQISGNRIDSLLYADQKSRSNIGNGPKNIASPAMDFISLCSPDQQYFLINAAASRQYDSSMFAGKSLLGKRYERGTCSEEGSRRALVFDANGGASIRKGNVIEEVFSFTELNQLALGQSLPTLDNMGSRNMQFYQFRDGNGIRFAIQEFVFYPNNTKNYIRIWY
ncbi:hypothetical protein [Iodobacter fluviatilis]|uniref:Uncharacterized protein n=1 Tax=Iodobacter fluviatilis TaxID=537 RepID=A0A377Q4X6_9NEIS|nr:hypothetical protein [Iodobacter fluviatilis]TCU82652.1 hypothetical protein EV682_11424 [Iodobacter fluviatilis]STQ89862.1 Uncharacterised protein [Iodobacter fluviatilis]